MRVQLLSGGEINLPVTEDNICQELWTAISLFMKITLSTPKNRSVIGPKERPLIKLRNQATRVSMNGSH